MMYDMRSRVTGVAVLILFASAMAYDVRSSLHGKRFRSSSAAGSVALSSNPNVTPNGTAMLEQDRALEQSHGAMQAKLCDEAIPKLPWKKYSLFLSALETAANRIGSISEIPLNTTVVEWTWHMISSNATAQEAHRQWLAAKKTMLENKNLTSCFDTVRNLEFVVYSQHPVLSRLEREKTELHNRLPAGLLSLSQSSQVQAQGTESSLEGISSFLHQQREILDAAQLGSSHSPGREAAAMVKAMFEGVIESLKRKKGAAPGAVAAASKSSSASRSTSSSRLKVPSVGNFRSVVGPLDPHGPSSSFISLGDSATIHAIHAAKCRAKCHGVIKQYAKAPRLKLKAKAMAVTAAINGALDDATRTLLGATLFNDVKEANLAYAKLVSEAIITYGPTKAVVLTWYNKIIEFLRFVEHNDRKLPGDVQTRPWSAAGFWPYFLAARRPGFHPALDGLRNADGAGDTGPFIATLEDMQDLAEEGNVREILTLMYRVTLRLAEPIKLLSEWANANQAQKNIVFNPKMLDETAVKVQVERVTENDPSEDFCVHRDHWVFAPVPGLNGYMKRNCNPDPNNPEFRFYVDHNNQFDGTRRVRFSFMDEVKPSLSDREIAYLYDSVIPAARRNGIRLCRYVNQLRKGHRRVPWDSGGDAALQEAPLPTADPADVRQGFMTLCAETGMTARGGPSGTTDFFMLAAKYFGVSGLDLVHFRNAIAAWMELANDHSFHEVLLAAEPYGLAYSSWLYDERTDVNQNWEQAFSWIFYAELHGALDDSLVAPFNDYLAKLHATPSLPTGELNCAPSDYLEDGHVNRRALQWWYFNGYASPPAVPALTWCIKPTPRREVPPGFIPAKSATADRIGYLQVNAYATPLDRQVTIDLGFHGGVPKIRVVEQGISWAQFRTACDKPLRCVTTPTRTRDQWNAAMRTGLGVILNNAGTDATVAPRDIPGVGRVDNCVSLFFNGATQYICSYAADIALLSHGIATMMQTASASTFASCSATNTLMVHSMASAPDQVVAFYPGTGTRFDTPLFYIDHNVVNWATARAFICGSGDDFHWFTNFVKAAARCPLATPSADPTVWAEDSHMELCTEGALRTHSFRCSFGADSPPCKTDLYWWRELAHRTAVCFYTHDTLYVYFRRNNPMNPVRNWQNDALAVMNDMARHPWSQSYFPPFTDSAIFSGFGGNAEFFTKLAVGKALRLDWRSFARTPDTAWKFGNSRKGGTETLDTAMIVLVDTPRGTLHQALTRARSLRNSFRIFDDQAEVLMPPAHYRVLGRKSFFCETALPVGATLASFTRPIGPYAEVYVEFVSWDDYGEDPGAAAGFGA